MNDPLAGIIDFDLPFANVDSIPLPLVNLPDETLAVIAQLHARQQAATHLVAYADTVVLDEDTTPALHHRVICDAIDQLLDDEYDDLVICTPPGAAKSTYTSHALGAYFMGRFPKRNVILATHTADLSEKWSRKVRNTLADPRHATIFPDSALSRDSTAVGRWATSLGGEFLAVGVGASILGFRCDCVVGNSLVRTKTGYTPISAIKPGDEVLSYDSKELSTRYRRVLAVAERTADITYRIHAADGSVVEATGNHPFHSGGKFVPAMALAVGDPLLSCVWDHQNDIGTGTGQEAPQKPEPHLLLQPFMCDAAHERAAGTQDPQDVQRVWEAIHREGTRSARSAGLLGGVPQGGTSPGGTQDENSSVSQLQPLREGISPAIEHHSVEFLLEGVQEHRARSSDANGQQPQLAGRERPEPLPAGQRAGVQGCAENGDVSGQSGMRDLRLDGEPSRSPCGRGRAEQLPDQRGNALPVMSHDPARSGAGETAETTVARIEVVRGNQSVFDIQVEGTANFFTGSRGQLLIHNCAIIDDPISGYEQAQSETQLQKVHDWFETDLITRLKPRSKIVLICQRLAANDLAGYLIQRNALNPTRRLKLLILRMEAEEGDEDGTQRQPGERLWPEWFTPEMVADARRDEYKWRTLYQQRPPSSSGDWVAPEHIRIVDIIPSNLSRYLVSDLALSVNKGDYSVHIAVGVDSNTNVFVEEAWRERCAVERTVEKHLDMVETYSPLESLIDDDNASKVYVQFLAAQARERRVPVPWKVLPMRGQDKETRAAPLRGMFRSNRIALRRAAWNEWLVRELMMFPNAMGEGVDDGVDALSLIGRRLASLARPAAAAPPPSPPKTLYDMTLDQLHEDREHGRTLRRI